MKMTPELGVKRQKAIDSKRSQQERYCQAHRVNRQQQYPFEDGLLGAGENEDGSQDGADAGSPAKGKGETDRERAPGAGTALYLVQSLVGVERLDLEQASEVQAKDDDDDARHFGQEIVIL